MFEGRFLFRHDRGGLASGNTAFAGLEALLARFKKVMENHGVLLGSDFASGLMENLGLRVAHVGRRSRCLELFRGIREAYQAGGNSLASGIGLCTEGHGFLHVFADLHVSV